YGHVVDSRDTTDRKYTFDLTRIDDRRNGHVKLKKSGRVVKSQILNDAAWLKGTCLVRVDRLPAKLGEADADKDITCYRISVRPVVVLRRDAASRGVCVLRLREPPVSAARVDAGDCTTVAARRVDEEHVLGDRPGRRGESGREGLLACDALRRDGVERAGERRSGEDRCLRQRRTVDEERGPKARVDVVATNKWCRREVVNGDGLPPLGRPASNTIGDFLLGQQRSTGALSTVLVRCEPRRVGLVNVPVGDKQRRRYRRRHAELAVPCTVAIDKSCRTRVDRNTRARNASDGHGVAFRRRVLYDKQPALDERADDIATCGHTAIARHAKVQVRIEVLCQR